MSARSLTPASRATSAAPPAVACSVSRARSVSSERNVASCTSRSAPAAAATTLAAGRRIAGQDELPTGARRAEDVLGRHDGAALERNGLSPLKHAALRPVRHAEPVSGADVEAARALGLDERIADGRNPVIDREDLETVVAAIERRAGLQLDQLERVRQAPEHAPERGEEIAQATRSVDRERELPPA